MINYLGLIGVQQWKMRPEMVAKLQEVEAVEPELVEAITEEVTSEEATENAAADLSLLTETESEELPTTAVVETVEAETVSEEIEQLVSDASQAIEEALQIATLETTQDKDNTSEFESEHESDFYVYAAVSLKQYGNEQKRWLWIVDQASLSREELKLLDNIVIATDSEWAESGLADGYMGDDQLKELLDGDLTEVVLFGSSHVEFFANKRVFVTYSISKLVNDADKKRQTWQGLKQLM